MFGKSVQPPKSIPPQTKVDQIDTLKKVMDGGNEKEKPADSAKSPD